MMNDRYLVDFLVMCCNLEISNEVRAIGNHLIINLANGKKAKVEVVELA